MFVNEFINRLKSIRGVEIPSKLPRWTPTIISKSGPGVIGQKALEKPSFKGFMKPINTTSALIVQAVALRKNNLLFESLKEFLVLTENQDLFGRLVEILKWFDLTAPKNSLIPDYLGRLGIKEEPGKVRVFAMVD